MIKEPLRNVICHSSVWASYVPLGNGCYMMESNSHDDGVTFGTSTPLGGLRRTVDLYWRGFTRKIFEFRPPIQFSEM